MLGMPALRTERLAIRPFTMADLADVYRLFDVELAEADLRADKITSMAERTEWLQWTVLSYRHLAKMHQPPYGDRAIILTSKGVLIGSCGYVPLLNAFERIPLLRGASADQRALNAPEFGLFYAIAPAQRRQGFATEAAQALVDYAFAQLRVRRVIATTTHDNSGSIAVMRALGMHVERNPSSDPPWLQVAGVIFNPG